MSTRVSTWWQHRQWLAIALVTALAAALVPATPVAAVSVEPGSYRDTFEGDADGDFPGRWSVVSGVGEVSVRTVEDGRKALHAVLTPGERAMLSFDEVLADGALTADASGLDVRAAVRMTAAGHPHAVSIGWGWDEDPRETRALGLNTNAVDADYRAFKHLADEGTFLGTGEDFSRSAAGEWIWARMRQEPASDTVEYKVWFADEQEPSTWSTATDMDAPINDRVGLWFYANGDQFVDADIAEFSVVPFGADHPAPIVPPVATITDGPSGTVETGDATFTFEADVAGASFECQLDGAGYESCVSPQEYTGLGDGSYTFEVRATADGLTGDPASQSWTVELPVPVAPTATITDGPSGTVETGEATFAFEADVAGASFECQLDGAGYESCVSPQEYTGLGDGSYTFEVRATADGLTGDPASQTWTVELPVPPVGPTPDAQVPGGAVRLVADWNGDGVATPGWFYRSQWTILEQPGGPIVSFSYGRATDTPVVGDWNGSGEQTVGVRSGNQ